MVEKSNVPEIRFAGFADPWEQRKLGELVDVRSGRDYQHLEEGPIPVYGTGGYMTGVNEALSYDEDAIGIGRKGTIDKPYRLFAPFWTVDTLFYAVPRENVNLDFALCLFRNVDWKSKDESTGLPSLSKTIINESDVYVPRNPEQRQIGQLFSRLDALITLHQRKHNNTDIEHATGEMRESTQMMSTPVSGSVYEPTDSDIDPYLAFYLSPTLGATHQLLNGDVTPHILVGILAEFHGNVCAVQLTGMNDLRHRPFVAHDIPPPSGTIRIPTPE